MAMFHTNVLDEQIKALPTVDTASGSVATFDTDMTENLVEVKCQIVAQQSGSGTPSPSNPRPITVYTSLNLSHSGADTSNPTVYNIPFGQTVAQGVLNVGTGKLRVTHGVVDLDDLNWDRYDLGSGLFIFRVSNFTNTYGAKEGQLNIKPNILCENYSTVLSGSSAPLDLTTTLGNTAFFNRNLIIRDDNYTSEADFTTAVTGVKLVYELATPIEIQLDSITLQALLNENNIWCDTGDTSVKYILSVGKAIS